MHQVLQRLDDKNLQLNLGKCEIAVPSITFLGHIIASGTLKPDPKNVQSIQSMPAPTNLKEVQCFLGMLNYYQDFLPKFTQLAEPLRELTRGGVKFDWTSKRQEAFDLLKNLVCQDLHLGIFDPQFETILTTDASLMGIGGVLSQLQYGKEVPIAFGHHMLDSTKRNWASNKREAYAAMFFCEHFEKYLLGRPFKLRTDHKALTSLLMKYTDGKKSRKFGRWVERLSDFNFTVDYVAGRTIPVPDALSRLIDKATYTSKYQSEPNQLHVKQLHQTITSQGFSVKSFQQATNNDPILKQVHHYIQSGWPNSRTKVPPDLLQYYRLRDELALEQGYIVRGDTSRILVPSALRTCLLKKAHQGHPGIVRFKRKLRECYWWPGMDTESERYVKSCAPFQDSAKSNPKLQIPDMCLTSHGKNSRLT